MAKDTKNYAEPERIEEAEYYLFDAPITEFAEHQGISIDEAVKLRVAAAVEAAPMKVEISVRPIETRGKLIGIASVNFGGVVVVDDFKVFNGENGLFVGAPSKQDNSTRSGYRHTARITNDRVQTALDVAAFEAYNLEVEKAQARAAVVKIAPDKPLIRDQLDKAAQKVAKEIPEHLTPKKNGKAVRDDR